MKDKTNFIKLPIIPENIYIEVRKITLRNSLRIWPKEIYATFTIQLKDMYGKQFNFYDLKKYDGDKSLIKYLKEKLEG